MPVWLFGCFGRVDSLTCLPLAVELEHGCNDTGRKMVQRGRSGRDRRLH